jgi:hypothetical protein
MPQVLIDGVIVSSRFDEELDKKDKAVKKYFRNHSF